jgi:hypothetical protein
MTAMAYHPCTFISYRPINLLANGPRRYVTMLIFVIMSGDILQFFFNPEKFVAFPDISSFYVQVLLKAVLSPLILISYLSIKFFPLFACLGVTIPILGSIIGFLYSILLYVCMHALLISV